MNAGYVRGGSNEISWIENNTYKETVDNKNTMVDIKQNVEKRKNRSHGIQSYKESNSYS